MGLSLPNIAIVCVNYHPHYLDPTLESLGRIGAENSASSTVYVANQQIVHEALLAQVGEGASRSIIRHDNSGLEFGAYQAGLDHVLARTDPDWVLFANDTFATHNNFGSMYRKKLRADLLQANAHPAAIGQVVSLPRSYEMESIRTHRWLTTHLFALNREALKQLDRRVYHPHVDALITETSDMAKFFSPELHRLLREHLEAWLFRARPGWHWYGSDPLTAENAAKMARKGRSVLQEKYLSARLEAICAEFVDLDELGARGKLIRNLERKVFDLKRR